jgi:hypothetical protein
VNLHGGTSLLKSNPVRFCLCAALLVPFAFGCLVAVGEAFHQGGPMFSPFAFAIAVFLGARRHAQVRHFADGRGGRRHCFARQNGLTFCVKQIWRLAGDLEAWSEKRGLGTLPTW